MNSVLACLLEGHRIPELEPFLASNGFAFIIVRKRYVSSKEEDFPC